MHDRWLKYSTSRQSSHLPWYSQSEKGFFAQLPTKYETQIHLAQHFLVLEQTVHHHRNVGTEDEDVNYLTY